MASAVRSRRKRKKRWTALDFVARDARRAGLDDRLRPVDRAARDSFPARDPLDGGRSLSAKRDNGRTFRLRYTRRTRSR